MAPPRYAIPDRVGVKRPSSPLEVTQLKQSLRDLKLKKLFLIPWNVTDESYVQDLSTGVRDPEFMGTIRARPELWTPEMVAKAFECPNEGEIHVSQRRNFNESYFTGAKDVKHGWKLKQCNNPKLKIFLKFIVPILHPRAHTYCTASMANLLILAWTGMLEVNWAYLLYEVIQDLAKAVQPGKKTPILSFLAQLYRSGQCMTGDELVSREKLLVDIRTEADESYSREISIRPPSTSEVAVTQTQAEQGGSDSDGDLPLSQRFPRFTPAQSLSARSPLPSISGALPDPSIQSTPDEPEEQTIFQQLTQSYEYDTLSIERPAALSRYAFPAESSGAESSLANSESRGQSSRSRNYAPTESQYSPTSGTDLLRYAPVPAVSAPPYYTHPPVIPHSDIQVLEQGNQEEDIEVGDNHAEEHYSTPDIDVADEAVAAQQPAAEDQPEEQGLQKEDEPNLSTQEVEKSPVIETPTSSDLEISRPRNLEIPISRIQESPPHQFAIYPDSHEGEMGAEMSNLVSLSSWKFPKVPTSQASQPSPKRKATPPPVPERLSVSPALKKSKQVENPNPLLRLAEAAGASQRGSAGNSNLKATLENAIRITNEEEEAWRSREDELTRKVASTQMELTQQVALNGELLKKNETSES